MNDMFARSRKLIGDGMMEGLYSSKVLVVGAGGVGGYVIEMLARSGVGKIGIMDPDVVDVTNKNRQLIALDSSLGKYKAEVWKDRINDINPHCDAIAYAQRFSANNSQVLDMGWDYIVDAIDSFADKVDLICLAKQKGLDVVSAAGAGNRAVYCDFEITDIYKTSYDALAKKLRKALKDRGIKNLDVCYTKEPALSCADGVGSMAYVPSVCGIRIAAFVISRLLMSIS